MKVFISWSGTLSQRLAEAIRDWLPSVIQSVIPYFTPSDIDKGARWSSEIAKELSESQFGILCVTRDNLHSDWILFEAGALSKSIDKSHVCPVLFGITSTDLAGPLKQFQATEFSKGDFQKLIVGINNRLSDRKLPAKTLDNVFDKWWPDLHDRVQSILTETPTSDEPVRSDRAILEEILQIARANPSRSALGKEISPAAIVDLLEKFIELHDQQENKSGGYQETLNSLKAMTKSVNHIVSRYSHVSDELDTLIWRYRDLSFTVPIDDPPPPNFDDDIPF